MTKEAFSPADLGRGPVIYAEKRTVRFQDVDAAGIVFHPRVLEYFSDVYIAFFAARGHSVAEVLAKESYGLPLAHAEADYARPLRFGDAIEVAIVKIGVGDKSFRVGYRVENARGEIAASGQTVHVCISRAGGEFKAIPIPPAVLEVLRS